MNQSATNLALNEHEDVASKARPDPTPGQRPAVLLEKPVVTGNNVHGSKAHGYTYAPAPLWVNLLYALGTLTVLTIPLLIQGISERGLMMGYIGGIVGFYLIVSIWGMVRNLRPPKVDSRAR